jgi:hypothetical protein
MALFLQAARMGDVSSGKMVCHGFSEQSEKGCGFVKYGFTRRHIESFNKPLQE